MTRLRPCALGAFFLLATGLTTAASAQSGIEQTGLFDKLAGPGEKLSFTTDKAPDGSPSGVKLIGAPGGGFTGLQATGDLTLDSPALYLKCLKLDYRKDQARLFASDNVTIRQGGLFATSDKLDYDLDTGSANLEGAPNVRQSNDKNRTSFRGMETFVLDKRDDGGFDVEMKGPREIIIDIKPTEEAAASGDTGEGFAGLGNNVNIVVAPRTDAEPVVRSRSNEAGDVVRFTAIGSVRLKSESFDVRCDELVYDGEKRLVEALYNVYLKKDAIDADCGRMLYELDSGRITLTVNPDVRQKSGNGALRVWDVDYFVIDQMADGSSNVDYGSPDGRTKTEYINLVETPTADDGSDEPAPAVEIDPAAPTTVPRR